MVIEVEAATGVNQDTHNVRQVVQLMFGKEFVTQVERPEDHVDLGHVVVVVGIERVVTDGPFRPRRTQNPELMQSPGAKDVRK
jgi:hypothetical protein